MPTYIAEAGAGGSRGEDERSTEPERESSTGGGLRHCRLACGLFYLKFDLKYTYITNGVCLTRAASGLGFCGLGPPQTAGSQVVKSYMSPADCSSPACQFHGFCVRFARAKAQGADSVDRLRPGQAWLGLQVPLRSLRRYAEVAGFVGQRLVARMRDTSKSARWPTV